jgi:signal peptide peptidase SppA
MPTDSQQTLVLPVRRGDAAKCAAQHFGVWAVKPDWFRDALAAVRAGTWKPAERVARVPATAAGVGDDYGDPGDGDYTIANGIAVIELEGQMTKGGSSFGGCSTIATRRAIRTVAADPMVKGIVLHICSPGGTVDGTSDLADDVAAAAKVKPVDAYVADLCCSAAYWVASQCRTIYANATAVVGSIGAMAVLKDDSAMQEQIGVKLTIVSSGEYKGILADGNVSEKVVAEVQRQVDGQSAVFFAAVAAGRGDRIADMSAVTDGRVYVSAQAQQLGLIDQVASFDAAMSAIVSETTDMTLEDFNAFAKANASAVKPFQDAGHAVGVVAGAQAEKDRFAALAKAFPDRPQFVVEQFAKGNDAAAANVDFVAVLKAENLALQQQLAAGAKAGATAVTTAQPAAHVATALAGATAHQPIATPLAGVDAVATPNSEASLAAAGKSVGDDFVERERRRRGLK